jgi:hypothetical protein
MIYNSGVNGTLPALVAAYRRAGRGMQAALFRPFDAARWLKLGFATFLAQFALAGLVFFSSAAVLPRGLSAWRDHAALLPLLLFSIPVALLLGAALYLLCLYLGSRAAFMTLHMLLKGDYSVSRAFAPYNRQAASYFLWNASLFLLGAASSFFLLGIPAWFLADGWPGAAWMGVPLLAGAGLLFLLALGFVRTLASDFLAPLMWRHDLNILQAWARFLPLLLRRLPAFALFYLAKLAVGLLVLVGVAAMGFFTCCLFFPLALLPVLGQALLQPVYVFFRLFSIAFLEALAPGEGPPLPPA